MRLFNSRFRHILAGPVGYISILIVIGAFLFTVFMFASGTQTVDVLADIKNHGTIVIGVLKDMPPYSETDDDHNAVGFEPELATMIGESILGGPGVQFFFINTKTARAYLDNGDCDILIAMVTVNENNQEDYSLTDAYVQEDVSLLCKTGIVPDLYSADTKIGVIRGSDAQTVLGAYLQGNDYSATVVEVPSYPDAMDALKSGGIHAFCAPFSVVSHYAGNDLSVNPIPVGHLNYAIAVRKSEQDLFYAIQDALKTVREDGRLNDLYVKYNLSAPVN